MDTKASSEGKSQELTNQVARPAPEWLTNGVMYQIWLRSFTPEGTLKAAAERLPFIKELGATVVYLSPIHLQDDDPRLEFWSPRQRVSGTKNPKNPYRIMDYNRIDPEFGTEDDLHNFVKTAHELGLYVLMDIVYLHCGPNSTLMDFPNYIQRDAKGQVVTGDWIFPMLNYESSGLRKYLLENLRYWLENFQLDGFRCDVSDQIPLDFWEDARNSLQPIRPDMVILAEGERVTDQLKAFDINYSFTWRNTIEEVMTNSQPASLLRQLWEKQCAEHPKGARFIRYTDNHDLANDMQRPEVLYSEKGSAAISVINFTMDGVPLIYNGQEIGDTTPHSIYENWPIRWQAVHQPKKEAVLGFYKTLCQLQRSQSALNSGDLIWINHNQPDSVVVFQRRKGSEEILSVVNLSNRSVKVELDMSADVTPLYTELLSTGVKTIQDKEKLTFEMDGFGYFVGKNI